MGLLVKICGVNTPEAMAAALEAGADMVGLMFFGKSPRNVTLETAAALASQARGRAEIVAVTVDADDTSIDAIVREVRPDWLQLHGREPNARVAAFATRCRVMKALGVIDADDVAAAGSYPAAERLLLDAKAPPDAALPGGNGLPFDWQLVARAQLKPFMLSGGLSPDNVTDAIDALRDMTALVGVDVSSGVERRPGIKDPARIESFVRAARAGPRKRATERAP